MSDSERKPPDGRGTDRVTVPIRLRFWSEDSGADASDLREGSETAQGSERRAAVRVPRAIEIEFWIDGTEQKGRVEDLSETGLFVSSTHRYAVGSAVRFRFFLPEEIDALPIEGDGTVVWTEQIGFAVEFGELDDDNADRLRAFIDTEVASALATQSPTP